MMKERMKGVRIGHLAGGKVCAGLSPSSHFFLCVLSGGSNRTQSNNT